VGEAEAALTEIDDRWWRHRFFLVLQGIEVMNERPIPNPEDAVANLACNHCGRIAAAWVHAPPQGWEIGAFGENDYCPDCR